MSYKNICWRKKQIMQKLVFVCGVHDKRFLIERGRNLIYYMCPNYKAENRDIDDEICTNFASRNTINIIRNDIEALYEADMLKNGYKNFIVIRRWNTQKPLSHKSNQPVKMYYEVTDINESYIKIAIKNERVIKNADDI